MLNRNKIWLCTVLILSVFYYAFSNTTNHQEQFQKMTNKLIKPPYLKAGDTIAIVATAGIIKDKSPILKAKELAESWGLNVIIGKNTFNQTNHFAGTDQERLNDFQEVLDNKNVKAIWCARGGYGTVRIIDAADFTNFKKNPKWIIGYSDITVLHSHLHNLGFETLHAILGTSMDFNEEKNKPSIASFKKALFGEPLTYSVKESNYNKMGHVKGQLVGGNLSILQSLLGSKSSINTDNKILFIEEIGEYHYQIDRMLYALKRAGYFDNCKGLIVGGMTKIRKNTTPWGQTIEELVLDITKEYDFPILFDFPAGHDVENNALILGREVDLYVTKEFSVVKFSE
ncbi:S66 peptidase family protein [Lutibacter maritimus]|uniref:Muramoyltetrapeptide carboxypeptidase n=1 Tax=Lutibacter maritimus TaxID=593133 RepID=A0A1I6PQY1_9FLAO|nr:LD-carboxypeptidase [Lutibacter maritimus]SFS42619.1 muramoyltetrapeptide carboxypeptidase [Lutibacter maritimus]